MGVCHPDGIPGRYILPGFELQRSYFATFATTYAEAPNFYDYDGFINDYYDDEGWWANAWVTVYDLTQNPTYLNMAISIYNDITQGQSHCGGIYWEKGNPYIAAIANGMSHEHVS